MDKYYYLKFVVGGGNDLFYIHGSRNQRDMSDIGNSLIEHGFIAGYSIAETSIVGHVTAYIGECKRGDLAFKALQSVDAKYV